MMLTKVSNGRPIVNIRGNHHSVRSQWELSWEWQMVINQWPL
jgi:hypothetical protein